MAPARPGTSSREVSPGWDGLDAAACQELFGGWTGSLQSIEIEAGKMSWRADVCCVTR